MTRVFDWRTRYNETIDAIRAVPFKWDGHDCVSGLVIPVVEAITGKRCKLRRYIKSYKTMRGALGTMHRAGFANLADGLAAHFPEIHPSQAQIGDLAAIPTEDGFGYALGVVNGDRVFVMLERSLGTRSLTEAVRAFRVD
jgi:hypothetical protein